MMPVNDWTCSQHDYPQQCECCERWNCAECEKSEWVKVGEREASPFEALLFEMPSPVFSPPVVSEMLLRALDES